MHSRSIPKTLVALAAALVLSPAEAQDNGRLKELETRLESSLRVIEALQKRVEQLEGKGAAASVPAGEWGARIETVERNLAQIEAASAAAAQADTGLPIHGFADVRLRTRNSAAATRTARGAEVGVFDLYMTPQISSQVKGLVEIAFEYQGNGELAIDAERMQLGYVFSDALTLWAGRFHTPYGYWNTAFHHGAQIQTAVSRPRFLDFEDGGGILPAHSVGLWATGTQGTRLGRLGYDLYLVNGDRLNAGVLDYQAAGDGDGNAGLGFRVNLALAGTGWNLGLHGLRQTVAGDNAAGTASGRAGLNMFGGYATYDNDDWEAMAEVYSFRNKDLAGGTGTHGSTAWYAQLGYNLNDQFTAYGRIEQTSLSSADPYFALMESGRSYKAAVAGLRYSLSPKAVLKAELLRSREAEGSGVNGTPSSLTLQYAVRF